MSREQQKKARRSVKSVDELIKRILDVKTSVEEARGLFDVLDENLTDHKHCPTLITYADLYKIITLLCVVGNAVDIHPSMAEHRDLRRRACLILAHRAIPVFNSSRFSAEVSKRRNEIARIICAFFAQNLADHCVARYDEECLAGLKNYFDPHSYPNEKSFSADGFRNDFFLALANLGLTDILVDRRDIGAIPVLSKWLASVVNPGWEQFGIKAWPESPDTPFDLHFGWIDYAVLEHKYFSWQVGKSGTKDRQDFVLVLEHHIARAGYVLADAEEHPRRASVPEEQKKVATSLAQLCAMTLHLVRSI